MHSSGVRSDLCLALCLRTDYPIDTTSQPFPPVYCSLLYFPLATKYDLGVSHPRNSILLPSYRCSSPFSLLITLLHNPHSPAQLLPPFCEYPLVPSRTHCSLVCIKALVETLSPPPPAQPSHSNQGQSSFSRVSASRPCVWWHYSRRINETGRRKELRDFCEWIRGIPS